MRLTAGDRSLEQTLVQWGLVLLQELLRKAQTQTIGRLSELGSLLWSLRPNAVSEHFLNLFSQTAVLFVILLRASC